MRDFEGFSSIWVQDYSCYRYGCVYGGSSGRSKITYSKKIPSTFRISIANFSFDIVMLESRRQKSLLSLWRKGLRAFLSRLITVLFKIRTRISTCNSRSSFAAWTALKLDGGSILPLQRWWIQKTRIVSRYWSMEVPKVYFTPIQDANVGMAEKPRI